ncbi:MAG: hypothetical protein J4215_01780 [Candidatus Diapherotrites archaeon]|uniref:Uncharacterized protein n=1 Tax=Candidatus Iainarchaeum sp. TaxID=3101447 RepID=A0A8T4L5Z9_9ARCH|nr:hypothetical protein [Candidatus Diapherotrites archaeon]
MKKNQLPRTQKFDVIVRGEDLITRLNRGGYSVKTQSYGDYRMLPTAKNNA